MFTILTLLSWLFFLPMLYDCQAHYQSLTTLDVDRNKRILFRFAIADSTATRDERDAVGLIGDSTNHSFLRDIYCISF